jgi:anti-sigma regulatory factor (Ser/Thr protein kinase)
MAVFTDEALHSTGGDEVALAEEYAAVAHSVRQAREAVVAFAERHGAVGEGVDDIRTAISEAATNVVVHAYDTHTEGRFRILAVIGGGELLVIIDDDGCGLGAPTRNPGLGMGLAVMEAAAEQARFLSREHGGSTVQLRFALEH